MTELILRPYQQDLITRTHTSMASGKQRPLIVLPTGGGKTAVFAWMANRAQTKGSTVWFLVHRKELLDQTIETFRKFSIPTDSVMIGMVGSVVNRIGQYERPDLIVMDECFVSGTRISGKRIERIEIGDLVDSYNHEDGCVESKQVTHVFKSKAPDTLLRINGAFVCTPNHPIYVKGKGYVKAKDIKAGNRLMSCLPEKDGLVRIEEESQGSVGCKSKNILFKRVCKGVHANQLKQNNGQNEQEICFTKNDREQSYAQRGIQGEDGKNTKRHRPWTKGEGRQWERYDRSSGHANGSSEASRTCRGTCCTDASSSQKQAKTTYSLQNRHSNPPQESRNRGRRIQPFILGAAGSGCQERQIFTWSRVESIEVYQRGRDKEYEVLCPDGFVYNLEVEHNNNYFAEGHLVHNCHHSPARTWQRIIDTYPNTHVIGLTATPCRLDGKPLGAIYDDLIEGPTTPELIKRGYLSKYRYITSEISIGALGIKRGDYDQEQAAEKLMTRAVYGNVIDTYRRYADGMQAIYFCTTIKHSEAMAEEFKAAGIRAEHFDGKTKKRERTEIIKRFRAGETQVLCNVGLVSEGFDMPGCDVVGMLRPTQSLNVYLQQVGRALRPRNGKIAVLIDHVGNLNRHGTPSDPRAWSLDAPVKAERAVNKDGSYQIRRCEDCQGVYESTSSECPYCGAEYTPTQEEIRTMEHIKMAEIQILQEQKARADAWKPDAVTDAKSYSDLCKIAKLRGYKTGWAYHQAKQRGIWVPY